MSSDRKEILARRQRFIQAALAGIVVGGCSGPSPQPCLNIAPADTDQEADTDVEAPAPRPCLKKAPVPPPKEEPIPKEEPAPGPSDLPADSTEPIEARPAPCLNVMPLPKPTEPEPEPEPEPDDE